MGDGGICRSVFLQTVRLVDDSVKTASTGRSGSLWRSGKLFGGSILPFVVVWALLTGPFLIWDFHSIWDDVYLFNIGKSAVNYAFGGTPGVGFPNVILYSGGLNSLQDYYPLWPYQLVFCGLLLAACVRIQLKHNSIRTATACYAVVLIVYLYFSRLFHDNYLGYIGSFLIISALGDRLDELQT
jgi:hypothetical protein